MVYQEDVAKARGQSYSLDELMAGYLDDMDKGVAADSSVSRGAKALLSEKSRSKGRQWIVDYAQGSLVWRINAD